MWLTKLLKMDLQKNKIINITLCMFILCSSLLVASGSNLISELIRSMNSLFSTASVPHFVQMHAGEIDEEELNIFVSENDLVKRSQLVEMIDLEASSVQFNHQGLGKLNVMDLYFVQQNPSMDFLLNLESELIQVSAGEIAVPIYYKQKLGLEIGDVVNIATENGDTELMIVDFVRDALMNPSVIHSKRFVIHENDFNLFKASSGNIEYLIEFELWDLNQLNEFRESYQSSNMPNQGPEIDYHLFKTLNAITDGIIAVLIIMVSFLLTFIALACIRFTINSTIEEDYKEIGVMKAIGIPLRDIKRLYVSKYIGLSAFASMLGYSLSYVLNRWFTANLTLYIGTAPRTPFLFIVPLLSVVMLFLFVILFCNIVLRVLKKGTAVEILRWGEIGKTDGKKNFLTLKNRRFLPVPFYMAIADLFSRFKHFRLLLFVFLVCCFMMVVPLNFLHTIQSPSFVQYMGVERSDLRIDMQRLDEAEFKKLLAHIQNDQDVADFSPFVTKQVQVLNNEGEKENLLIETGDFSRFPLAYVKGKAPNKNNELAISHLNSQELQKTVGDSIRLIMNNTETKWVISGVYQDVTNGGRTGKIVSLPNELAPLWYEVAVNYNPNVNIAEKKEEYMEISNNIKVTDLKEYMQQTFGNTIDLVQVFTIISICLALMLAALMTSLFLKMLVAKDTSQISLMKKIGFSIRDIKKQYLIRIMLILGVGLIVGLILSKTAGEGLASAMLSFMGAAKVTFVIDPFKAYVLCPLIMMIVISMTTILNTSSIKK